MKRRDSNHFQITFLLCQFMEFTRFQSAILKPEVSFEKEYNQECGTYMQCFYISMVHLLQYHPFIFNFFSFLSNFLMTEELGATEIFSAWSESPSSITE